jgi:hypothetical protein
MKGEARATVDGCKCQTADMEIGWGHPQLQLSVSGSRPEKAIESNYEKGD